jgi:hypothetical protein
LPDVAAAAPRVPRASRDGSGSVAVCGSQAPHAGQLPPPGTRSRLQSGVSHSLQDQVYITTSCGRAGEPDQALVGSPGSGRVRPSVASGLWTSCEIGPAAIRGLRFRVNAGGSCGSAEEAANHSRAQQPCASDRPLAGPSRRRQWTAVPARAFEATGRRQRRVDFLPYRSSSNSALPKRVASTAALGSMRERGRELGRGREGKPVEVREQLSFSVST